MVILILFLLLFLSITLYKILFSLWYWKKRNVFYSFPLIEFIKTIFSKKQSIIDVFIKMYKNHSHLRYFGTNFFSKPALFICDKNLVKQILISDNHYFSDHFDFLNGTSDLFLGKTIFAVNGSKWKNLRNLMTPIFTTKKLKAIIPIITEHAKIYIDSINDTDLIVEKRLDTFYGKYTSDVMLEFASGIKDNSLNLENYGVYSILMSFLNPNIFVIIKFVLNAIFPKIFQYFRIPIFSTQSTKSFFNLIKKEMNERKNNINRIDALQYLLNLRNQHYNKLNSIQLTDEEIVAQVFFICFAGTGTSSTTLTFLTYELALHPKIQQKLQIEIDQIMRKNKNKYIDYENLLNMTYLDQIINETLRKWSPSYAINRICKKNYILKPENDNEKQIVIEKGCILFFSALGFHYDSKLFSNPEKFDPERFNNENKEKIATGSYLPFLIGGRNCIGSRFAMIQMKIIIVYLLHKYELVPVKRTQIPVILGNRLTTEPYNGIYVGFKKRF